jgi:hypothetical protein
VLDFFGALLFGLLLSQDCAIGKSLKYIEAIIKQKSSERANLFKVQVQAESSIKDVEHKTVAELLAAVEVIVAAMPIQEKQLDTMPVRLAGVAPDAVHFSRSNTLLTELHFDGQVSIYIAISIGTKSVYNIYD